MLFASVRRSVFSTDSERSVFLTSLMTGVHHILETKHGLSDAPRGLYLYASAESRTGREVPCSVTMAGHPWSGSQVSAARGRRMAAPLTAPSWSM